MEEKLQSLKILNCREQKKLGKTEREKIVYKKWNSFDMQTKMFVGGGWV